MPLTYSTLADWLVSLGVDQTVLNQGPFIPKMPDELTTLTLLPGLGYTTEGALDNPSFQVRCRSGQNDQQSAEAAAFDIDSRIFRAQYPITVDGVRIVVVDRLGGAPAPLGPPDDAERIDYVCTYRAVIGT